MTDLLEGTRALDLQGEVHDIDDQHHTVAVDFPHEQLDAYRTDFAPQCFDEYLAKQLPVMLVEHDRNKLIGHGIGHENGQRSRRLIGQFSDFDAVPLAKQYYAQIRDGDIPGWSYHFRNAKAVRHPTAKGGLRFIKADMPEFGPTVFPAIPGTKTAGLRSEEFTVEIPTLDQILQLKRDGFTDDSGVRSLIAEHHPHLVEHIRVQTPIDPEAQAFATFRDSLEDGQRSAVDELLEAVAPEQLSSARKTLMAVSGTRSAPDTDADSVQTLVQAVDACLGHAVRSIGEMDVTELPENVQEAVSLMSAAENSASTLRSLLNIDPSNDAPEGNRANDDVDDSPWSFDASQYTPEQLKSACLVVSGDNKADCHLPVKTPDGKLNRNAVHAAAGALAGARGGVKISDGDKKTAAKRLMGLYDKVGDTAPDSLKTLAGSGQRSTEDTESIRDHLAERFHVDAA